MPYKHMFNLPTPDGHSDSFITNYSRVVQAVIQPSNRCTTGHYRRTDVSHSGFTKWAFKKNTLILSHKPNSRSFNKGQSDDQPFKAEANQHGQFYYIQAGTLWRTRGHSTRTVVQTATRRHLRTDHFTRTHTTGKSDITWLHTTRHGQTDKSRQLLSLPHPYTYRCSLKYKNRRAGHSESVERQINADGQHATRDENEDVHER